jgi:hypothetical protein
LRNRCARLREQQASVATNTGRAVPERANEGVAVASVHV